MQGPQVDEGARVPWFCLDTAPQAHGHLPQQQIWGAVPCKTAGPSGVLGTHGVCHSEKGAWESWKGGGGGKTCEGRTRGTDGRSSAKGIRSAAWLSCTTP